MYDLAQISALEMWQLVLVVRGIVSRDMPMPGFNETVFSEKIFEHKFVFLRMHVYLLSYYVYEIVVKFTKFFNNAATNRFCIFQSINRSLLS